MLFLIWKLFGLNKATYTNESLEKISKRDMINIVLSVQSKLDEANKPAVEEICKLSDAIFGTSV